MTPGGPPDAWTAWRRHGVAQFHQPHNLFPRFRQILDREMPEMQTEGSGFMLGAAHHGRGGRSR